MFFCTWKNILNVMFCCRCIKHGRQRDVTLLFLLCLDNSLFVYLYIYLYTKKHSFFDKFFFFFSAIALRRRKVLNQRVCLWKYYCVFVSSLCIVLFVFSISALYFSSLFVFVYVHMQTSFYHSRILKLFFPWTECLVENYFSCCCCCFFPHKICQNISFYGITF